MRCEYHKLEAEQFDLAIVGSGIHGSILAHKAARAGYRVALVDKNDFGSSTSANSLKIIHGGIRYLQHLNFKRMRESILSRRSMMRFAPHLVKPLSCLMPTYGHGLKGREMMRLAFGLYDLIACDRNQGLPSSCHLPGGGALSLQQCKQQLPGIKEDQLNGAALWYDAIAINTERLLLDYLLDASRYGAVMANYTEATSLMMSNNVVSGIIAVDRQSGREYRIRAHTVINTAGPWVDNLPASGPSIQPVTSGKWARAVNVIVKKRFFGDYAVGLEGWSEFIDKDAFIKRGKRLFFFVPWQEQYTMIGTSYRPYHGSPESFVLEKEDIEEMLGEINKIYPEARLEMADVTFCHGGLLPRQQSSESDEQGDTVQLEKSTRIIDHARTDHVEGIISISGVKYTTAPDIADKVLGLLKRQGKKPDRPRPSYTASGTTGARPDHTPLIRILGSGYDTIRRHLQETYGPSWRDVFDYLIEEITPETAPSTYWICDKPPLLSAEVRYFIKEECAKTLADIIFRRSPLGSTECPAPAVLEKIADIMAVELDWDEEQRQQEITATHAPYLPLQ